MPQVIEMIPDDELKTDYHDALTDIRVLEKLASWTNPLLADRADHDRARLDANKAVVRVIKAEAARRGLEL